MKKFLLVVVLLVLCVWNGVEARRVDSQSARRVAVNFWNQQKEDSRTADLDDVSSRYGMEEVYIFANVSGAGFVVVAADDIAQPILGYSLNRELGDALPPATAYWLKCFEEEIVMARNAGRQADVSVKEAWHRLAVGESLDPSLPTAVAPMITTTWNQSPYYNTLCPDGSPTGCTATATAQVMKFWEHPQTGTGSHSYTCGNYGTLSADFGSTTYDWGNMPSSLSYYSTQTQVDAVATLMYHIGVAVEMGYTPSGSGANAISFGSFDSPSSENALVQYFGYKSSIHGVERKFYGEEAWKTMLRNDIDAGRPVVYVGFDVEAGHSFVCDGYDNNDMFHINWGWGGYCDGYYRVSAMNPTPGGTGGNPSGTYNIGQQMLLGIEPNRTPADSVTVDVAPMVPAMGTVSGSGRYASGSEVRMVAYAHAGYRFVSWDDGILYNPRSVRVNTDMTLRALYEPVLDEDTIRYDDGFMRTSLGMGSSNYTTYWGVRFEASDLGGKSLLKGVTAYLGDEADYTVYVYQGGTTAPTTLLYTETRHLTGGTDWCGFMFDEPVTLDTNRPLWIAISVVGLPYPACMSGYAGNDDAGWFSTSGTSWTPIIQWGYYNSFMVRGILGKDPRWACDSDSSDFSETFQLSEVTIDTQSFATDGVVRLHAGRTSDGALMELVVRVPSLDGLLVIPEGSYPIDASGAVGTVQASMGLEHGAVVPSYAGYDAGGSRQLWLMRTGTVTVSRENRRMHLEVSATNTHGRQINVAVQPPAPVYYMVSVMVSDEAMGRVTGGGVYEEGDTATLTAVANEGFHFVGWSNGETTNPYTFEVLGDVTIGATFASNASIEWVAADAAQVYPNPTTGKVYVALAEARRVEVVDAFGRVQTVSLQDGSIDLTQCPKGVYLIRVLTDGGCYVAKVLRR